MIETKRIAAYGVLTDKTGRVLAQQSAPHSILPGSWWLPGGQVEHGEDPADTVVREFAEETGLEVKVTGLRKVCAAVVAMADDHSEHNTLFVYDVEGVGGELAETFEDGHATNTWVRLSDLDGERMSPTTATMLDLERSELVVAGTLPSTPKQPGRRQRVGVYAWVTRPDGRVLMTSIAAGSWGEGLWHLPGGGIDFGESPEQTLVREVAEETSQQVVLTGLRAVQSSHKPHDVGPGGEIIDFQGIHIIYNAEVVGQRPLEIQDVGGSTSQAQWMTVEEIRGLPVTTSAEAALAASLPRMRQLSDVRHVSSVTGRVGQRCPW